MLVALLVLACLSFAIVVVVGVVTCREAWANRGLTLAREVIVHTTRPDDQSVRGVLIEGDRPGAKWLKLDGCRYGQEGGWVPLDGQVLIPTSHVAFVQDVSGRP
ncbi:MAG: hypothetical protein M0P31_18770 [Solirubrobacteraceae bacterium]|nr:hypothetical protein [Solirubrobacteraceae bacterium]